MEAAARVQQSYTGGPRLVERKEEYRTGADIQIENGQWFKVHNDIADALAASNLNGLELRLLWYLLRMTYGWQRKDADLTYNDFAEATKSSRKVVIRYLKQLEAKNVIQSRANDQWEARTWWFNKYHEQWKLTDDQGGYHQSVVSPQSVVQGVPPNGGRGGTTNQGEGGYHQSVVPNTKKGKTRKTGERQSPPDASLPKQPHTEFQAAIRLINAELPIAERQPYIDPVANYLGVKAILDADIDDDTLLMVHRCAVDLHKLGVSVADLRRWWPDWKKDYRSRGPTCKQLIAFASEHKRISPATDTPTVTVDDDLMSFLEEQQYASQ